jgi:hypothetical protein
MESLSEVVWLDKSCERKSDRIQSTKRKTTNQLLTFSSDKKNSWIFFPPKLMGVNFFQSGVFTK